ncbi:MULTISPECIES: mannose-1-phosphate guanylyltransferase/mannose-6-phosphate isomerase [Methylobacterium]|jgi:mannose-1-phosphate guanylyltransferase/mannose-6-phosphate isomerase|uniref:mannose-1-phosphate guanylyltransferase/mannose-6-phosphate isomerase n=2 Tax=Methylobacteriaceae TaxID=119045 RepID=UPI0008E84CD7|nr:MULTISPECIES: mannose-1-phosphate guanylyltransferase/mannose-6-phosphate isomerase [Methylobacterium]MBK3401026.1 mannose-1-phosphate guanylyltransferase/mannose-6-phosphate isomerase [Methylobacterium ajmalii]MBK3408624.1 mannose-1-phosphate guanylyltransferase/mannose-6-phosphate isomerase [Methylobacterium ajmalii]MBZ6415817.1 mannose-1-phosphate guanylyltransferase/mannose-6-phosphate isomerase [Methylobacterium sp.]SFF74839.1 mannose-1-phosphate guanylyltransferase / mannose-6-phosphat
MAFENERSIHPVILCGGSGTRLWPASRESFPKQFIPLAEPERSSFQATAARLGDPAVFARPTVVTANDARFLVAEQLAQGGIEADILLEPCRRDSAPAVAVAALHAAARDPQALVLILPADHAVGDDAAFAAAVRAAGAGARAGHVMTLGITPTNPSTAYGYIQPGAPLAGAAGEGGACAVARFLEKPDAARAAALIADGALWNGGYFLFRADVMLDELEAHAPAVLAAARDALEGATRDLDFVRLDAEAFARAPQISIDYAVMERTERAGVLPVRFPWSDIGTWGALWEVSDRDGDGNAVRGRVALRDTRDSLVHSSGGILTTVVGLEGVVVVTTDDAVLVTGRTAGAEVKGLVEDLRRRGEPEADAHRLMYRPWGSYRRIDIGGRFQVKRITVKPGGRLSLQKHHHRAEHWVVVRGTAEVTVDGVVRLVHENEAAYLPIGCVHRLANPGKIPLELIEVQVGSYTGEDDIIRIDDVYGR